MAKAGRPKIENKRGSTSVDAHVGARVRLRRTLLGMSQEKLGEALGLTFQQVQKYERGMNRVGASRLFALSKVLDVPVSFFFDDLDEKSIQEAPSAYEPKGRTPKGEIDPMAKRETLELVRAYYLIEDAACRRKIFELTKAIGEMSEAEAE